MHAATGLHHVNHHQTNHQCDSRHDFKIQQRITAGFTDPFHIFHAGDANHHSTEDDGRNNHLNQLDKTGAKRLHRRAGVRIKVSERDTDGDGEQHLKIEAGKQPACCLFHLVLFFGLRRKSPCRFDLGKGWAIYMTYKKFLFIRWLNRI